MNSPDDDDDFNLEAEAPRHRPAYQPIDDSLDDVETAEAVPISATERAKHAALPSDAVKPPHPAELMEHDSTPTWVYVAALGGIVLVVLLALAWQLLA